ncbi:MAG: ATP-dependent Clp protease proteolytic subunit [Bacteroidia bacterium]|nr:ATP-dependent Clp protease proteolytic subunit [Bacteroidia bacterium]
MKLKKTLRITADKPVKKTGTVTAEAKGGKALIKIRGYLGSETLNAEKVAEIVDEFLGKGIKDAVVYLSSPGGNVFDASEMVAELKRFDSVQIQVGAMAASAATRFLTDFPSEARPNSQFMIHKPMMPTGGNETEIENDLKLLKDITAEYRKAYATKMGKTEDEIEKMWSAGDKWMTAAEAKEAGLVDDVTGTDEPIDAEAATMLQACGAPNSKQTQKPKKKYMERDELISSLGLDADATDEQIKEALEAMKKKAADNDSAQKSAEAKAKAKAEKAVLAGITAKKIPASQKEIYVQAYINDPEGTADAIESLPVQTQLSAELDKNKKKADLEASRKDWKLEDYLDKDPEAYNQMRKDDPERAGQLEKDYFGGK